MWRFTLYVVGGIGLIVFSRSFWGTRLTIVTVAIVVAIWIQEALAARSRGEDRGDG